MPEVLSLAVEQARRIARHARLVDRSTTGVPVTVLRLAFLQRGAAEASWATRR